MRQGKIPVEELLFAAFACLVEGSIVLRIVIIYFLDLRREVEGGFGLCGDGFLYGLLLTVFLTAILLALGTYR